MRIPIVTWFEICFRINSIIILIILIIMIKNNVWKNGILSILYNNRL